MEISDSIKIMKALADSSRLMILNSLMEKSQYVEELSERFDLAPSTISFHLKKLEEAGLVSKTKDQYYVVYHVNDSLFSLSLKDITMFNNIEKFVQEERIEIYRQKVLRSFFKKKKLIRMPAQRKKRLIVLNEFGKKFKPDTIYSEQEINNTISRHYKDYCIIRRELIDEGIMERKNQKYWVRNSNPMN